MGDVVLTKTRVIRNRDGGRIAAGRYVWRGPRDQPVFHYVDSREVVCEDVRVDCETECSAVFRVERVRTGAGIHPSTLHQWRNVRIKGNGKAVVGFDYCGIDENREHGRWDACSVYGCLTGWRFLGTQSKEHLLTQCRFESGVTALSSDTGFQWIGGTVAVCDTGIFLTRVGDPVLIQGVGFEACKRLLLTVRPSTDSQPIALVSCRYAADQLHDDGGCIVLTHAGPLTIIGGSYGDGDQRVPHIELAGIGEQAVHIAGAKFGSFGAVEAPTVVCKSGVRPRFSGGVCTYQQDNSMGERSVTSAQPNVSLL